MTSLRVLVLLCLASTSISAMDRAHFIELNNKGRELRQKQDWNGYKAVLLEIRKELPHVTPTFLLRMALAEAHLGNHAAAIAFLAHYAAMGLTYDISADKELSGLLKESEWKPVADRMLARAKPINMVDPVCAFPIADLMPEDVTAAPQPDSFFVSSVQHHGMYRVRLPEKAVRDCALEEVRVPAEVKAWPSLAISSAVAGRVWITSAAMSGFSGVSKDDEGKSSLFLLDPAHGKLLRRLDVPGGQPAVLGDMTVAPDSTVYVSDSVGGGVYRVRGGADTAKLESVADGLFSPQTPVLAADGRRLFVPDYPIGIAILDLQTKDVTYLPHPEDVTLTGIDGLCLAGDSFIAVQNGTDPERIVRLHLNPQQTRVESVEIIAQGPQIGDPTHAIGRGQWIYVLTNVGWNKVDDHGHLTPGQAFRNPVFVRFHK